MLGAKDKAVTTLTSGIEFLFKKNGQYGVKATFFDRVLKDKDARTEMMKSAGN